MRKPSFPSSPRNSALIQRMNKLPFCKERDSRSERALSIIEMLVSVSIVAVLSVLGGSVYSSASQKAAMSREVQAAKVLVTAFNVSAADNNGRYIRGFDEEAADITLPSGELVSGQEARRYPFRLAAYFDYKTEGTILVNKNKAQLEEGFDRIYGMSLCPALAMNQSLVGGVYTRTAAARPVELSNADQVLTTQAEGVSLLAFVSGGFINGTAKVDGYFNATPPYTTSKAVNWGAKVGTWNASSSVMNFGNVDARYGGKAVSAFTDGSIKMLSMSELADMRLWSKQAKAEDKPDYTYAAAAGGGR